MFKSCKGLSVNMSWRISFFFPSAPMNSHICSTCSSFLCVASPAYCSVTRSTRNLELSNSFFCILFLINLPFAASCRISFIFLHFPPTPPFPSLSFLLILLLLLYLSFLSFFPLPSLSCFASHLLYPPFPPLLNPNPHSPSPSPFSPTPTSNPNPTPGPAAAPPFLCAGADIARLAHCTCPASAAGRTAAPGAADAAAQARL